MSAQTIADVFAPVEAHYRAQVLKATWGHLAPAKNKTYRGHAIFAFGCFGSDCLNPTVLECEIGLDSSPWFYDALIEFLGTFGGDDATGGVYRWDGTFRNYEFKGSVRRLPLGDS
jgi:hypothetical protein